MRRMFAWKAVTARLAIGSAIILAGLNVASAQEGIALPAPAADVSPGTAATETAVFAGGCFWGVERILWRLPGVVATAVVKATTVIVETNREAR